MGFDDGFALMEERALFSVAGGGRRITVELLAGYPYAQVFAPKDKDYIAFEPMTAPTSALTSGRGLRLVKAGEQFRAVFRIRVDALKECRVRGASWVERIVLNDSDTSTVSHLSLGISCKGARGAKQKTV